MSYSRPWAIALTFPTNLRGQELSTTCMLLRFKGGITFKRGFPGLVLGQEFIIQYLYTFRGRTRGSATEKETFQCQRLQLGRFSLCPCTRRLRPSNRIK